MKHSEVIDDCGVAVFRNKWWDSRSQEDLLSSLQLLVMMHEFSGRAAVNLNSAHLTVLAAKSEDYASAHNLNVVYNEPTLFLS